MKLGEQSTEKLIGVIDILHDITELKGLTKYTISFGMMGDKYTILKERIEK